MKQTPKKQKITFKKWHLVRRTVQVLVFAFFLFLLLGTRQDFVTVPPQHFFFHLDPLAGIAAILASRSWIPHAALGVVVLLSALAVGRAWCGWLCPLGTVLDWTPSRRPNKKNLDIHPCWRQAKDVFLFIILFSAVLGSLTLIILDPITLLFRTLTSFVLPALSFLITNVESWLYSAGALRGAVDWFDGLTRSWLISEQPFFLPNFAIAALFAGVLALNAIRLRFWCRYLCPLGGLLGIISKSGQVHHKVDTTTCTGCQRCAVECHTGAIDPGQKFVASPAECTACLECIETCPTKSITFSRQKSPATFGRFDLSRRKFLTSLGLAAAAALLVRTIPVFGKQKPLLVRPPGASEESISSSCIRCGECVKVCPTSGLQPASSTRELDGLWTPELVSRRGYCDYSCNSCGQVCPTGAIPNLTLAEKREKVIGIARIDEDLCIPYAEGRECIVCEEMCPVPEKAIILEPGRGRHNTEQVVRLPKVLEHLCTGCGICEYKCPVNGESAIRIFPPDEA